MNNKSFWTVIEGVNAYRYKTLEDAERQAKEWAERNHESEFIVFQALSISRVKPKDIETISLLEEV